MSCSAGGSDGDSPVLQTPGEVTACSVSLRVARSRSRADKTALGLVIVYGVTVVATSSLPTCVPTALRLHNVRPAALPHDC